MLSSPLNQHFARDYKELVGIITAINTLIYCGQ